MELKKNPIKQALRIGQTVFGRFPAGDGRVGRIWGIQFNPQQRGNQTKLSRPGA
jgi:hypothetical protein